MGSSKKYKDKDKSREHKKKHHRSRSRSQERKHKHRDRDSLRDTDRPRERDGRKRKRDYDDSYSQQDPIPIKIPGLGDPYEDGEMTSRDISTKMKEEKQPHTHRQGDSSLSVEDSNALRAKLGLKPLDTTTESSDSKPTKKEDVHVPPVNMNTVKKQKELMDKLKAVKEKRRINTMLGKVKTLADEDDDDDVEKWVKKMKANDKERKLADKRAKMLEEMDNELGLGELVEEEFQVKKEYTSTDLRGLKVQHNATSFKEGRTIILTLEDKGVLEEGVQTLINVNMVDDEAAAQNVENRKRKPGYVPYDEPEFDEQGMVKQKDILQKYNTEIDGEKKDFFKIGSGGGYSGTKEKRREQILNQMEQQRVTLSLPNLMVAKEFYTADEMESFNKVKKKVRKIRKKVKPLKAADLMSKVYETSTKDLGRRVKPIDTDLSHIVDKAENIPGLDFVDEEPDVDGPEDDLSGVKIDDEVGIELQLALEKARKLKAAKHIETVEKNFADKVIEKTTEVEEMASDPEDVDLKQLNKHNITLNQTSEFCRALGDIPTYGQSGNREEDEDELMDYEEPQQEEMSDDGQNPGWQQVAIDEIPITLNKEDKAVLDEEPLVGIGLAAALDLASKKGYLHEEKAKRVTSLKQTGLEAENYSIEDKRYDDLDEKFRKRDRYGGGMISDFKEKDGYNPNVQLEYVDESGRKITAKEAFRHLSHRFHGKGSGKMKTEKRKKKIEEEMLMLSMSSTDTPLGTAAMLENRLERQGAPYLVLSGSSKNQGSADRLAK